MNQIEALSPSEIHDLEIYKSIVEGKPLNHALTLDDIEHVKTLAEELKQAEQEDKAKIEKINKLESIIEEKRIQLETLRSQLNQKLLYLREHPTPIKPTITRTTNCNNPINKESVIEVLKANPYGLGNAEVCKKLNVANDKANQNRAYNVMKALESEGKVKSENRLWKAL